MNARSSELFKKHQENIFRRTDRMFAALMILEYFSGIIVALVVSPKTWTGAASSVHLHVWVAIILGALILSLPIGLAIFMPGKTVTRHVIAVGQMLYSGLLIHLTGGRIETHFHIFGSLAFLGFYRDWKVLISASLVVAIDHFFRGLYWPQSVFGVLSVSNFRWLEHTAWVVFEDIFIGVAIYQSIIEMQEIAERRSFIEKVAQERAVDIQELQETKTRLKSALQSKDAFLSICGHELKTPLTSLSLQTQITKRSLSEGTFLRTPDRIEKLVNQTDTQMKRLLRLVQDMLDHSRIQSNKMTISPEKIELCDLVKDVIEQCQVQADAANCSVWLECDQTVAGFWDRFRIEQVLTNLITNAIKYGAGKPIEVTISKGPQSAFIAVKDHGIGIAEENYSKVFRQFERVSESNYLPGLGLGLYISKNIIEQHGGKIQVKSTIGTGSVFTVELPIGLQVTAIETSLSS